MTCIGKNISFFLIAVLLFPIALPAYAEVTSFQVEKTLYIKGDQISFSGTVEESDTGLVTIVFRDSYDKFVLLTQAFIQPDNTFERIVSSESKFTDHGIHNATAFILNLTKGKTASFDFSVDGSIPIPSITKSQSSEPNENTVESGSGNDKQIPEDNPEICSVDTHSGIADFVDTEKDSQYYLDRYYNESAYKEWFDKNYPDLTIEEAIGLESQTSLDIKATIKEKINEVMPDEIIPDAEAVSIMKEPLSNDNSTNRELVLLGFALGGLVILFGAVYGIKRKVDANSKNISENRTSIRKKMFGSILGMGPQDIIKNRLAHGEITVTEYNNLRKALEQKQ